MPHFAPLVRLTSRNWNHSVHEKMHFSYASIYIEFLSRVFEHEKALDVMRGLEGLKFGVDDEL